MPFSGRDRWGEVLVDLVLAGVGGVLLLAATSELSGREPVGLWLLAVYTAFAVAVTVLLALVVAVTSRLPVLEDGEVDGRAALGVRSWAAPWWHTQALDLGLAVLGLALGAAGVRAGGSWAVVGAALALLGLWFAVRVALVGLGRRRRPAIWLTESDLVVDSPAGRGRAARSSVRAVRGRGRRLVVDLDEDAEGEWCPRPWRRTSLSRRTLVLDCGDLGHRAGDLEKWLTAELGLEDPFRSPRPGHDSNRR
ncbi:hypothetical protein CXG46_18680 [Nocardioides alpinus]|uniref:PH domain-containing protein n=1 Tax=Nocardioides alpinus TaxID=748909 RepID=A0ABX4QS42_9ACTN|nr:hypothetical protein CXG46_18680 [Nocardioides alpinus]